MLRMCETYHVCNNFIFHTCIRQVIGTASNQISVLDIGDSDTHISAKLPLNQNIIPVCIGTSLTIKYYRK